jgi:hypothetical protein
MIVTRTARIEMMDDWCVVVRIQPDVVQDLGDASDNLAAVITMLDGVRRPLLSDIRVCAPIAPEVRRVYSSPSLRLLAAQALLVDASALGRTIGEIYRRVGQPGIPTEVFDSEPEALAWLQTFV